MLEETEIMRIFDKVEGTHEAVVADVVQHGTTVQPETVHGQAASTDDKMSTKEVLGYSFKIRSIDDLDTVLDSKMTKVNRLWAEQEFIDRINNEPNPGKAVQHDAKWQKFLEADGKYAYTYGERWAGQLQKVIAELAKVPNTRQAIITTWDSNIDQDRLSGTGRRIPCTVHSQFLLRDGKLNQIYYIRSNDAVWIMASDIYQMCMLQKFIANQLQVNTGFLLYHTGSLHIYKRDADLVKARLGVDWT